MLRFLPCAKLEIFRSISSNSDDVTVVLNDLAAVEHDKKDYFLAERDYHESLRIAKINNNDASIAALTGNLVQLAIDREHWAEAESLGHEALAMSEKVGRQELIAHDSHRIAIALLKQKRNLDEALALARRAVEIMSRLRNRGFSKAKETLAEIEKAIGKR